MNESLDEAATLALPKFAADVTEEEFRKALQAMAKALKKPLAWVDKMIYKHYIAGDQLTDKGRKQKAAKQGIWAKESAEILEYLETIFTKETKKTNLN